MPTHTATYLYEPDSFIPLAQLTAGFDRTALAATGTDRQPLRCYQAQTAQLYYFQTDHLGTPQDITDTEGHIVWSGQYRAWGQLAQAHNGQGDKTHIHNPFRFQGQYHDRETGLHYNRFRYYDPRIGRFTTQDPIGLMGGDNLYQYAPNPTGWVDPLGLSKKCCGGGAANGISNGAENVNAQSPLRAKLSGLEKAQQNAAMTRQLPDGRVRYYTREVSARTEGPTRGASFVTEHNLTNGDVRQWMESYDHSGNINRVHPKSINGQTVNSQHYPPTARELGL